MRLVASEAPNNWLYGDLDEVIWSTIAFVIVAALLYKFAWGPMVNGLRARTAKIERELGEAAAAKAEAEQSSSLSTQSIADPEPEARRIVAEAKETAAQLAVQLRARADEEAIQARARAVADIQSSKAQAMADLRSDVSKLAFGAAEGVVRRNLDDKTQSAMIDDFISQVGA